MPKTFQTIGLIGKPNHHGTHLTLKRLHHWLSMQGFDILVEERVAAEVGPRCESVDLLELGERCDVAIVVGGDGNVAAVAGVLDCDGGVLLLLLSVWLMRMHIWVAAVGITAVWPSVFRRVGLTVSLLVVLLLVIGGCRHR